MRPDTRTDNEVTMSPMTIEFFRRIITLTVAVGLVVGSVFTYIIIWSIGINPNIPKCPNAGDVIIGDGNYNSNTGYWSEYHCISDPTCPEMYRLETEE